MNAVATVAGYRRSKGYDYERDSRDLSSSAVDESAVNELLVSRLHHRLKIFWQDDDACQLWSQWRLRAAGSGQPRSGGISGVNNSDQRNGRLMYSGAAPAAAPLSAVVAMNA